MTTKRQTKRPKRWDAYERVVLEITQEEREGYLKTIRESGIAEKEYQQLKELTYTRDSGGRYNQDISAVSLIRIHGVYKVLHYEEYNIRKQLKIIEKLEAMGLRFTTDLSKLLGLSDSKAGRLRNHLRYKRGNFKPETNTHKMMEMYKQGNTLQEIGDKYGYTRANIGYRLEVLDPEYSYKYSTDNYKYLRDTKNVEEIVNSLMQGMWCVEVAEELGLTSVDIVRAVDEAIKGVDTESIEKRETEIRTQVEEKEKEIQEMYLKDAREKGLCGENYKKLKETTEGRDSGAMQGDMYTKEEKLDIFGVHKVKTYVEYTISRNLEMMRYIKSIGVRSVGQQSAYAGISPTKGGRISRHIRYTQGEYEVGVVAEEMLECYKAGLTVTEIGEEFGCTATGVIYKLEEIEPNYVYKYSKRSHYTLLREDAIIEGILGRYAEGKTSKEVTEEMELSNEMLARVVRGSVRNVG